MDMVYVPGGTFVLSEQGRGGAGAHQVTLNDYWIDQTEVTNLQYAMCVEAGDCLSPTTCSWGEPTYEDESYQNHPVICVTWQMASTYCEWAGGRLPTDAEWDYAARGPERSSYPWGNRFDETLSNFCDASCSHEDAISSDFDDGYSLTSPVGHYPDGASWCGALDMSGNVWEWVADWYAPYGTEDQENPAGPSGGVERIIRGGSWYDTPDFNRADHRHPFEPEASYHLIGFRCVVPDSENNP
jgi:formylglycine-generating enzyme required for sulfatase activity